MHRRIRPSRARRSSGGSIDQIDGSTAARRSRRAALLAATLASLACTLASPALSPAGAALPTALEPVLQPGELLVPSALGSEARYGSSVALSADGSTALVGAPADGGLVGSVFAFTRSGSSWTQQGPKLTLGEPLEEPEEAACKAAPGECGLGASVALSADGNVALIGAPRQAKRAGAVWVFVRSGSVWSKLERLTAGPEEQGEGRFGRTVAISADGSTVLVGAPADEANRGSAWVFTRSPAGFVQQGPKLLGPEELGEGYFGRSVALSADGGTALVGSPADDEHAGSATAFAWAGGDWLQQAKLTGATPEARFGFSVALSADGSTAVVGGRSAEKGVGGAWAFARTGSEWGQGTKLIAPDETKLGRLGFSVALSANGDTALIGAPYDAVGLGAAWLFARSAGAWAPAGTKLLGAQGEANGQFGWSVAMAANEGVALIGAPRENANGGSAWSFFGTPQPPPSVSAVSPGSGPSAGGTVLAIKGAGFLAGATVQIGGVATAVHVVSETEITAVTPAGAAGSDEVVVSDLYGTSAGGPKFTYTAPASPQTIAGKESKARLGALSISSSALPAPTLGLTGNLAPLAGLVRVKLPGSHVFVLLSAAEQVPLGTIVDARNGTVSVTTTGAHGETQIATFYSGEFKLTQARNGVALAALVGGDFSTCPTAKQRAHRASAAARRKAKRKLWGEVHGSYSTKGNYATGAALGTRWLTEDFCDGTLIVVTSHRVQVTNLRTHRRLLVSAGHQYFAHAP